MAQDREYVIELARTVHELFADGHVDPSASEIAHKHFGDRTLGGEIIEGVRSRLTRVRALLEEDGYQLCPLSHTYYTRFRRKAPQSAAEARRCLATGRGKQQEGLLKLEGTGSAIWREWKTIQGAQAAGKSKRFLDGLLLAYENGNLAAAEVQELLANTARLAQPSKPEIAGRLMQALPPMDDHEEEAAIS